ncbi:MAG: DegT/DnrJ/EryC1/StrS family aminotransferase, partial [Myxococcaceae bacterium]
FVDIAEDYNIDVDKIELAITSRTKAIMPVHLTGRSADMDSINNLAKKHNLAVIEDSAQAIGAKYKNKRVGSLGTAAGFSLHPLKNLGVYGDAGLISTCDFELYSKINRLRNHGLKNRDECEIWGYNSRLDPMQAAFALVKLKYLDSWNERHRQIASYYRDNLKNYVWVPEDKSYEESVYHNFVIKLEKRDELSRYLEQHGIGTRVHYPIPIHMQACAEELGYHRGDFPVTERLAKQILSLPIYPELTDSEVEYVVNVNHAYWR